MHPEALIEMTRSLKQIAPEFGSCVNLLDIGSYNVNGTYRELVDGFGWDYTGLDLTPGPNVDVVAHGPYEFPFQDETFDVIISGSTLEHVEMPWKWMPEAARLLRSGGCLIVITHTRWPYHPFPKDLWRFMPDGMKLLFDITNCLTQYDISMYCETDIRGMARKI